MVNIEIEAGLLEDERIEAQQVVDRALFGYIARCVNRPKKISIRKDGDDWVITMEITKPEIVRTRRITGYLSNLNNFHDAKKAEERDRRKHFQVTN